MNELITANKLIKLLAFATIAIIAITVTSELLGNPSWQIERLMDFTGEGTLPAWFSSFLLIIAAFFAYKCSTVSMEKQSDKRMWQLLSLIFLLMSLDETAQLHENIGMLMNKYIFHLDTTYNEWLIWGVLITLSLFLLAWRFKDILRVSKRALFILMAGAGIYLLGGLVIDSFNYFLQNNLTWLANVLEESLEMFGAVIIIYGLVAEYKFLLIQDEHRYS